MNGEAICECVGPPAGVETTVTGRAQSNCGDSRKHGKGICPKCRREWGSLCFLSRKKSGENSPMLGRWCVCLTEACGSRSPGIAETLTIKSELKVRWERLRPVFKLESQLKRVPGILDTNICTIPIFLEHWIHLGKILIYWSKCRYMFLGFFFFSKMQI